MKEKLENGPYRRLRTDPLKQYVKQVDRVVKECQPLLGINRLKASNPALPRIKGLPKIHKPGKEMRQIVSARKSPMHQITKWLVKK